MYARPLLSEDEQAFDDGIECRLREFYEGQKVVLRIVAQRPNEDQLGMEYGATLQQHPDKGFIARVVRASTGTPMSIPLSLREDGTLMSHPLPDYPGKHVKVGRYDKAVFPPYAARPPRPYGYILSEDYAVAPIKASPTLVVAEAA